MDDRSTVTEELGRIRHHLEIFLLGGEFTLYEDELLISTVAPHHSQAQITFSKLIFSCWGQGWSRSWRVTGGDVVAGALRLHCSKKMGRARCVVELRRGQPHQDSTVSRSEFASWLKTLIESSLPACSVERAIAARDDRHHLSGNHARFVIKDRGKIAAGLGVSEREPQANLDAALGAGLLWLNRLRRARPQADNLMIFVPRGRATTIATRMTLVRPPGASVSLFEFDEQSRSIKSVAAFDQGDLADHLRRRAMRSRWPREQALLPEVAALVESIAAIAPDAITADRRGNWIAFSARGLEFARISTSGRRAEFGVGGIKKRLDAIARPELERLALDLISRRSADSSERDDEMFRAQSERWLESIIKKDVTAIDPTLDPRYVYSQVPAYRGEHRSFIDLLAATRDGQLVVIELKVAEDAEFPFQALDYWLRVEWHRRRGDFHRRGYFRGLKLADRAPLLYLIAPLFCFHATTKLIASSICDQVPVYRIGINEDWRAGARALLTERLN